MATATATRAYHGTLTANTPDTITLTGGSNTYMVINRGSTDLFYRTDGTAAVTGYANDNYVVQAGAAVTVTLPSVLDSTWSVISTSAPNYSIQVW